MLRSLLTIATKSVFLAWTMGALGAFAVIESNAHDPYYAATWASISALGAAAIAGIVKVMVTMINTSRSRREQRQIERDAELSGWHQFYTARLAFKDEQLLTETSISTIVRNARHQLLRDIGARDAYIEELHDTLRGMKVEFTRQKFLNVAEAFLEEDEKVAKIVERTLRKTEPVSVAANHH